MSVQAEQEVIATLLAEPHKLKECNLEPGDFSVPSYSEIYKAMASKQDQGKSFDIVTLGDYFEQSLPEDLAQSHWEHMLALNEKVVGGSLFTDYCEMVRGRAQLRKIQSIAERLKLDVSEHGDPTAADRAITELMSLNATSDKHSWTMEETIKASLHNLNEAAEREGLVGIPTGLPELDQATAGWQDSDLIVIGARPAMGKTASMLNFANCASVPAGIISAEQPYNQIGNRMLSIEGSLDAQRIRTAELDEEFVNGLGRASRRLMEKPIYINDKPGISISEACRQGREWVHKYGVKILFADYIQKFVGSDPRQSAKEKAAEVASALKNLARELQIPVVALSQVNREVDKRPDPRPNQGDLSNAAEIEQEADLIIMLYRDEVYFEDTQDQGIAEYLIEKNRAGPIGRIKAAWIGRYMQFKPLSVRADGDEEIF